MKIPNPKLQISHSGGGFIFLEILVAVALISLVFITLLSVGFLSLNTSKSLEKTAQADALLKEMLEGVRSFRDGSAWGTNGLGSLATGSSNPQYPFLDTSANPPRWSMAAGTQVQGIFSRSVVFDKVSRNPSTNSIEDTYVPANDDPDTRKVTAAVSFEGKSYQLTAYFTNWNQ